MPKKTRIYEAITRNGHGEMKDFYVAPTKAQLKEFLTTSETKVIKANFVEWADVRCSPDENESDVRFSFDVKGNERAVCAGELGHKYLKGYFHEDSQKIMDHIAQDNGS